MKRRATAVIGCILCSIASVSAQTNGLLYEKKIAVIVNSLERQGDSVVIELRFDIALLNLSPRQSLTPVSYTHLTLPTN